jgi:hypothetical protein
VAEQERLPPAGWGDLPRPPTSFMGRAEELRVVGAMLAGGRVVTLYGPAGAGKTHLSLEVAAVKAARFPDGGYFRRPRRPARARAGQWGGGVGRRRARAPRAGGPAGPDRQPPLAACAADPRQLRAPPRRLRRGRRRADAVVPRGRDPGHQPGAARPAIRDGLPSPADGSPADGESRRRTRIPRRPCRRSTPPDCSWRAPSRPCPVWPSRRLTPVPWHGFAPASTGCRSRSSWPRAG